MIDNYATAVLLPSVKEQESSSENVKELSIIGDVGEQDITLEEVLDLDSFINADGLKDVDLAGFIAFDFNGNIRLVAAGDSRDNTVRRITKQDFKARVDPTKADERYKVVQLIPMPTLTIVQGSKCVCTHGGAVVNICKKR